MLFYLFKNKKTINYCKIINDFYALFQKILFILLFLSNQNYAFPASNNETSAGAVIVLYQPDYGKFSSLVSGASQPPFPSSILLIGGDATFMKKGFFTGGRVLYGSTSTSSISTSASTYEIANFGLKTGYGFDLAFIDLKMGSYLGIGNLNFALINGAQSGSILVDYIFIEPFLMIGIPGGRYFKPSVGGGYHYTFPYKVTTYGTTLLSDPSQATVSGVMISFELSFGDFGSAK